jgi:prophage DNA circulation protein
MSWRDTLGPASFRGAAFFVPTVERGGGRRLVLHEYPFRDQPFAEDLGQKARTFPVEGYVIGEDYITARDALLDALEAQGSGQLTLPYQGSRNVAVGNFRVRETDDEGGMARFQIEFVETPVNPIEPSNAVDGSGAVIDSASIARGSIGVEFLGNFQPGVFVASAERSLNAFGDSVLSVVRTVPMEAQALAQLHQAVTSLQANVAELVAEPTALLESVTELFDQFESRPLCLGVYSYVPGPVPVGTTPDRVQELLNFNSLQQVIQRLAVIRGSELILQEDFTNFQEAVSARESLTDLVDQQAEVVADDTYPAMVQLRASLVAAVPGSNSDLPNLITFTPITTLPSLLVAFRLYGDVERELDLVARNDVSNPAFVQGNVTLEILSDG